MKGWNQMIASLGNALELLPLGNIMNFGDHTCLELFLHECWCYWEKLLRNSGTHLPTDKATWRELRGDQGTAGLHAQTDRTAEREKQKKRATVVLETIGFCFLKVFLDWYVYETRCPKGVFTPVHIECRWPFILNNLPPKGNVTWDEKGSIKSKYVQSWNTYIQLPPFVSNEQTALLEHPSWEDLQAYHLYAIWQAQCSCC